MWPVAAREQRDGQRSGDQATDAGSVETSRRRVSRSLDGEDAARVRRTGCDPDVEHPAVVSAEDATTRRAHVGLVRVVTCDHYVAS